MIQPSDRRINLIDVMNLILDFNETNQLDLAWKKKHEKHKTKNKNKINAYFVKCKKDIENIDPKCLDQKNNRFHYGDYDYYDYYEYYDDFYDYYDDFN